MATTSQTVQKLYIAYFGRPADPAGATNAAKLVEWTGSPDALLVDFGKSAEYTSQFAGLTSAQIVNTIYNNLFGRNAEATGLNFWAAKVDSGEIPLSTATWTILSGVTAGSGDDTAVNSKVSYAESFTAKLATDAAAAVAYNASTLAMVKAELAKIVDATTLQAETGSLDTFVTSVATTGGTGVPGQTFTLTAGIDTATSNQFVANPVTNALGQINQTFNTGDKLTGTGTNPTLTVLDTGAAAAAVTPTLTGVETLNYTNFAAAGPAVITGNNITGLKNINVSNSTQGLTVNALQTKVEKVGITNTGTATIVQVANAALAGTTDEVSVTLNKALNGSSLALNAVSGSNGYETIKVNVTGENSVINAITTNTANTKTITFAGDKDLTVGAGAVAPLSASLTTIDASALTGKFVLGGVPTAATNSSAFATVAGAAIGSVTITGTGKDDVIALSDLGQQYKIVGGDGADTLVVTAAAGAATVATVGTGAASITGIETLRVVDGNGSALAGNVTVNLLGTSGITALQLSNGTAGENANVVTLSNQNHAAGFAINAVGTGQAGAQIFNGVTYAPLGVTGATDKVTVNVGNNGVSVGAGNNVTIGALTLTGIEQVAVNVKDLSSTSTLVTAANPFNAAGLTTFEFNVEGGNATAGSIALGNVGGAAVANAVINSGAGVTAAIGNIAAGGTSVVLGGAGNHTITLQGVGATVINGAAGTGTLVLSGGAGADTILGGTGGGTITGAAGADTIDLGADGAADFVRADEGHGAVAVAGTFVAVDTVTNFVTANDTFQVSGAAASVFLNGAGAAQAAGTAFTAVATGTFDANGAVGGALITGATAASLTNEANVIAAIGAVANETAGEEAYFVVANTAGTQVGVYHFIAATADNAVTAGELELIGVVTHTGAVTAADFVFA